MGSPRPACRPRLSAIRGRRSSRNSRTRTRRRTFRSTGSRPTPHNWIGEMFSSSTAGTFKNAAHYKNPKVDELLDQALRSTNQAERAKLYEEVTRIVVDDAAGLWIYNTKWYGPYSNKIKGIVFCPIGSAQEMRTAYYESES